MSNIHLIDLTQRSLSILEQLRIEEALLRTDDRNWCLINSGSTSAIVMGISGKPEQLIHLEKTENDSIPIIKRFSGGGTVVVDHNTLFVTFIGNHQILPCAPFPQKIMKWTEELYHPLFGQHQMQLRENDYVIGDRKFGGNAQSITKGRWLHHTTFLWDYDTEKMDYLKNPQRAPQYRERRHHKDFLCCLKDLLPSKEAFFEEVQGCLKQSFSLVPTDVDDSILLRPHRQSTCLWKKSAERP